MFIIPRRKKIELIFFSSICLQSFYFSYVSFGSTPKMLCLFFLLSELPKAKIYFRYLKLSKVGHLVTITIIGVIILELYSTYAHNPLTAVGLIVNDLISKYFVILYAFVSLKSIIEIRRLLNIAYWSILIATFFGLLNLFTGTSIISDLTGGEGTYFANKERVRIVGMFTYAFDYGYTCCILSILAVYGYSKKILSQSRFLTILICSLIGIVICGCRTIIVVAAAIGIVYIYRRYNIIKALGICIFSLVFLSGAYLVIPSVKEKVNSVFLAFDIEASGEDADGSSLVMRIMQYDNVLYHIRGQELLGRGYRFFTEGLGFNKNGNGFRDLQSDAQALMGLEGVLMNLLLERGVVGVIVYCIFYGGIFGLAFKNRKTNPDESTASMAIIIGFICFGNMTGELSGAIITLLLSGAMLKMIQLDNGTHNQIGIQSKTLFL